MFTENIKEGFQSMKYVVETDDSSEECINEIENNNSPLTPVRKRQALYDEETPAI